jgi:2-aminoethylphosphonate-pyruvate transaminase
MSKAILFTPGPLNTSEAVRAAMARDLGSRTEEFVSLTNDVRRQISVLSGAGGRHEVVLIQGSGTFALEAMLGSLVRSSDRLLVLVNGAYGERIVTIAKRMRIDVVIQRSAEHEIVSPADVAVTLDSDLSITHVAVVHGETTTGILNPLKAIADVVAERHRRLLVDAIATLGAEPLSIEDYKVCALAASSNKCLEGAPGLAFVVADRAELERVGGNPHSLSLDLFDQARQFERNGQWRFTPPTHVVAALWVALQQLEEEGGVKVRRSRYVRSRDLIISGFEKLGFQCFLSLSVMGSIIVTIRVPDWPGFELEDMLRFLSCSEIYLYPGKISQENTFRVGCIGDLQPQDIERMLDGVARYIQDNCRRDVKMANGR